MVGSIDHLGEHMRRLVAIAAAVTMFAGAASAGPVSATSAVSDGHTLYVTNANSDNIAIFTITNTGDLRPVGNPVPTSDQPRGIVFAPSGEVAYVVNSGAQRISSYRVGPRGELTLFDQVGTNGTPFGIAVSPRGDAVFVTTLEVAGVSEPTVSAFTVRPEGNLEPAGDPLPVGDGTLSTRGIATSVDGRFVFVGTGDPADPAPGALTTLAVRADHTLELRSTAPIGPGALGVGVTPNGRFVYVAVSGDDEIQPFRIAPDGRLRPLPAASAPDLPASAEVGGAGRYLFVTVPAFDAGAPKGVWVFTIRADGTLRPVSNAPTAAGGAPAWPAATPDARLLYVTNEDTSGKVFGFDVAVTGALTPLAGSPFPAGGEFSQFQSAAIQ
jgi:6-phosphogluconolactonase (cycloisomerase 2 family)